MNKLILTLLLLYCPIQLLCMDTAIVASSTENSSQMIDRAAHNQKADEIRAQIAQKKAAITAEKIRLAKEIVSLDRRWDLKNAITPAVYTLFIGGKAALDVYTFLNAPEVPAWFNYTNFGLDGALGAYCVGKVSWHLIRACCRKPKIE